ncbi:MAG: T9SS type A sorting domain-containing protein [Paludibacteraceae bacterium]|nr:T9SS type A sorting domain-containing protein [Paludibacteraceae bacterium]MBQ6765102.1 T9SS type A sorting domain-containing protein [Paludibacteraceae bacterium]
MKKFLFLLMLLASTGVSVFGRVICDTACHAPEDEYRNFAVVSPVGRSMVTHIQQAPRLETLDGKTIAVVGVSFMAHVTHPEIKRLLEENYKDVTVLLTDEMGYAGSYPGMGIDRQQAKEFKQKLIEHHVDAVIAGNGGCGICTPKETGSAIAAEYLGIPAVVIAGPGFTDQARYTAYNNGIAVLRTAEYPGAFATHTEEQLISNTREVVWPQLVDGLTKPITQEEIDESKNADHGDIRDDVFWGDIHQIDSFFVSMQWSDGLPFVPPTYEEANRFLEYSGYDWHETVVVMPGAYRNVTAWHVAVNAVMAGCKPEYMPLLIAMTKAMAGPEFRRTLLSTHGWVPYCIINGPIARQLGLDNGQGQINERANMTIGRFLNLAVMNMMGYYVKSNRMGTFGYPMAWCLVEDDAACVRVGWEPFHVQRGLGLNESAVTVTSALLWGNNMAVSTQDPQKIMQLIAWDCSERGQCALGSSQQFTPRTILMTEPTARILAQEYETLEELEDSLIVHSRRPVKERAFANLYANTGGQKDYTMNQYTRHIEQSEGGKATPTEPWYDRTEATQKTVATMRKDSTVFIITGDTARNKVQVMPGGAHAIYPVEVPEHWNELMEQKGYAPLETFFLTENSGSTPAGITSVNTDNLPVTQRGYLLVNEHHAKMAVFDASGKMVAATTADYNMRSLPAGVYLVRIAGVRGVCKIIKQ